jgi:hypothetical protein
VLPVSVSETPFGEALGDVAAAGDVEGVDVPELPQAASKASGASAAAVHAKRILLATSEYSFVHARFHVRYIGLARGCVR